MDKIVQILGTLFVDERNIKRYNLLLKETSKSNNNSFTRRNKMSDCRILDIDNVARIGLMYIDGDTLEDILVEKLGHTDYVFENFNIVKKSLMKLEKINPELRLISEIWQRRIDNEDAVFPAVAGRALPIEGSGRRKINRELKAVFETGVKQVLDRGNGVTSYYYPVKNSDAEIVGALELISGVKVANDI
jgi:hypothetical protein